MKISLTNLIFIMLLLAALGLIFIFYTDLQEAKNIIKKYEDIEGLNIKSEQFIKDFIRGDYKEYLTGAELKKYKSIEEETYQNSSFNIEEINIKQLFTKTVDRKNSQAESYATVEVRYETSNSEFYSDSYFQTLVIKTNWVKDSEEWKINRLQVSLLGSSEDELLRKQAQEALQNT